MLLTAPAFLHTQVRELDYSGISSWHTVDDLVDALSEAAKVTPSNSLPRLKFVWFFDHELHDPYHAKAELQRVLGKKCEVIGLDDVSALQTDSSVQLMDGLKFGVRTDPNLRIEVTGCNFKLLGPDDCVHQVSNICGGNALQGRISPPVPITVVISENNVLAIPPEAHSFAFAFPLPLEKETIDDLVASAMRLHELKAKVLSSNGSGRLSSTGGVNRQRSKGALVESPVSSTPMWLDFILVGGFVYFDKNNNVLRANALGLNPDTSTHIVCYGPHTASVSAGDAMMRLGRMEKVTYDSLQSIGLTDFGWLNPAEEPGGKGLAADPPDKTHPDGGFMYRHCVPGGKPSFFYYALAVESGNTISSRPRIPLPTAAEDSPAVSGRAATALDDALRKNVEYLRTQVQKNEHRVNDADEQRRTQEQERCAWGSGVQASTPSDKVAVPVGAVEEDEVEEIDAQS